MLDDGEYSGSVLFIGVERQYIYEEKEQKQLEEISAIIQNRMNLQRHNLLAQISLHECHMKSGHQ